MALRTADGTVITQSTFTGSKITSAPVPQWTLNEDVYEDVPQPGTKKRGRVLKWKAGTKLTQRDLDDAYAEPTISTVTPATGPAAGGTVVTVNGTNLLDATGMSIGGVACTSFAVLGDTQVRGTTGAHAAGAVNVVVTDDAGSVTKTNGFTYT